jgi:hypothetical protein
LAAGQFGGPASDVGPASPAAPSSPAEPSPPELPPLELELLLPEPEELLLLPEAELALLPLLELDVLAPPLELPLEPVLPEPASSPEACGCQGDAVVEQCRAKPAIAPARISTGGVAGNVRFIRASATFRALVGARTLVAEPRQNDLR